MYANRPIIGVTLGDIAGIGPEIVVKSLLVQRVYGKCRPVIIGDTRVVTQAARISNLHPKVNSVNAVTECEFKHEIIDVLDLHNVDPRRIRIGKINVEAGKAAAQYIHEAVKLALQKEIHSVATAPINKEAMNKAGFSYPGQTELFVALSKVKDAEIMLISKHFRIVHVTRHVPLNRVAEMITKERVLRAIRFAQTGLTGLLGIQAPTIGVSALNPHCGDGGLLGLEEINEIEPAVKSAQREGINAIGPISVDAILRVARKRSFDGVVVMYHDQGHIAVKMLGITRGVNVTLGLPIIRTSVDHGTNFGKAGKGTADPTSLIQAIKLASVMCRNRRRFLRQY